MELTELHREGERLDRAERVLGHVFRDRALLLRALTHSSFVNEHPGCCGDNEALELLGDSVLSLAVVEALMWEDPAAGEGVLTARRAARVSEAALVASADAAPLAELARAGRGLTAGLPRSARADLLEALLGAVYLDAGFEAARACVARLVRAVEPGETPKNPKSVLAELTQRLAQVTPRYEVEREGPKHAPRVRARVLHQGEVLGDGEGSNKQLATEAAAAAALARLPLHDEAALRARLCAKDRS